MILKNLVFQSTVIKFRIVAGGLLFVIVLRSVTLCEILHFGILTRAIMWVLHESACSDITSFNADSKDAEILLSVRKIVNLFKMEQKINIAALSVANI